MPENKVDQSLIKHTIINSPVNRVSSNRSSEIETLAKPTSREERYSLYLEKVKNNWIFLKVVPEDLQDIKMYSVAIQQDLQALRYIQNQDFCQDVLRVNGLALQHIPLTMHNQEMYRTAVRQNLKALDYIPEEKQNQELWIIAADNIAKFFSNIKHVIVTDYANDNVNEIKDSIFAFINTHEFDKTICVNHSNVDCLFADLQKYDANSINLVFLGHTLIDSRSIAGVDINKIFSILRTNNNIHKVTLAGCHTAAAKKLEHEKQMITAFAQETKLQLNAGFACLIEFPSGEMINKTLNDLKSENAYFLLKYNRDQHYLMYVQRETNHVTIKQTELSKFQLLDLQNLFKNRKPFKFPSTSVNFNIIKTSENTFTMKQLLALEEVFYQQETYVKSHPYFNKQKQLLPHLGGMTIDTKEAKDKLKPSLLKTLFELCEQDPNITVKELKAYPQTISVNVNSQNLGFLASTHGLFNLDYMKIAYHHDPLYQKSKDSISPALQKKNHIQRLREMSEGKIDGPTTVKSITVKR